jgi:hypothetical protein
VRDEQTVVPLPYRWTGSRAERRGEGAELFVCIPGQTAPFVFFTGEAGAS